MCALIAMSVISSYVSAQKELGIFNSLSVGVSAGTTGIGVDVATRSLPILRSVEVFRLCRVLKSAQMWMWNRMIPIWEAIRVRLTLKVV